MINKSLVFNLFIVALVIGLSVSCKKESEEPLNPESKTIILNTQDLLIWHYFSFSSGTVIGTGSADPANSDDADWGQRTDWDIAFHYKDLRTNSGLSGIGEGGMLEASKTNFNKVLNAPSTGYTIDEEMNIRLTNDMPPQYLKSTGSMVCNNWAMFDRPTETWTFAPKVFIVRTTEGKYVKIWLKSFLDDADDFGTITMVYAFLESNE